MANNARKKERHRLKRQKKHADMRRKLAVSPYRRIGQAAQVVACYINREWKSQGQTHVTLLMTNPAGGHVAAVFFIDFWCCGLKDVWGSLDYTRESFDRMLDRVRSEVDVMPADLDTARRMVAGAVRFARRNGFRLPANWERWVNVVGALEQTETADLADFGIEGKLRYVGPESDLRRRYLGSVADFVRRPDVEYIVEPESQPQHGGPEDDVEEDEEEWDEEPGDDGEESVLQLREMLKGTAGRLAEGVRRDLLARKQIPHPQLEAAAMAWFALMIPILAGAAGQAGGNDGGEAVRQRVREIVKGLDPDIELAMAQIMEFMDQFDTPNDMLMAVGLGDEPEPDEAE